MKKLFTFLILISSILSKSQAPQKISYQAVARDAVGNIITTNVGIKFELFQSSVGATLVYEETHTAIPSATGIFTVFIGGGTPVSGNFGTILWSNGPYFLRVSIDPTGGNSYSVVGSNQLVSVPYALYAETAGNSNSYTSGNGIAINSGTIINTAPNQTVNITGPNVSGSYPNYTINPGGLTPGYGIAIGSGTITNTAGDQIVNISQNGITSVNSAYPNFTVSVPSPSLSFNSGTKELTLIQGIANTTATLSGLGSASISLISSGIINASPSSPSTIFTLSVANPTFVGQGSTTVNGTWPNYTVSSNSANYTAGSGISITSGSIINTSPNQTVNIFGAGTSTVSGTYPNYTVSSTSTITPPVIQGAGVATVTPSGNNFTVNVAPIGLGFNASNGVLNFSPAPGTATINILPNLTFSNNILGVGTNSVLLPGTGLWARSSTTATTLSNLGDQVGLGTNIPTTRLTLFGANSTTNMIAAFGSPESSLRLHNDDLTPSNYSSIIFSSKNGSNFTYEASKIIGINKDHNPATQEGELAFLTRSAIGLIEKMRITSAGDVGIGTNMPNSKLDVVSNSFNLLSLTTTGANSNVNLDGNPTGSGAFQLRTSTPNPIIFATNNIQQVFIDQNGRVGIGNSGPIYKLDVLGNAKFIDGTISSGYVMNIENNNVNTISSGGLNVRNFGVRSIGHSAALIENLTTKIGGNNSTKIGLEIQSNGAWGVSTVNQPNVGLLVNVSGADNNYSAILMGGSVGINTINPTAELEVNGFTKLGTTAPAIKTFKLIGLTPNTQGSNLSYSLPAFIAPSKIISITVLVQWTAFSGDWINPGYNINPGFEYGFYIQGTNLMIATKAGNSGSILSKPFVAYITYEP